MGSVHYCHELETWNQLGDILCYLPGILAEKLEIGWDCVSISQAKMRLENLGTEIKSPLASGKKSPLARVRV
jgi:hypothetical protein